MSNIEINNIDDYMTFHGHTTMEGMPIDENFVDYMVELYRLANEDYKTSKPNNYSLNILKGNAKEFFKSLGITLHDVGYFPDDKVEEFLKDMELTNINELITLYNKGAKFVSPFDIAIKPTTTHCFNALTKEQLLICENSKNQKKLLSSLNVFFDHIEISSILGDITTASYIHEITHTQLEDQKGIIDNLYNAEVLSIFNELLYAYSVNDSLLLIMLRNRVNEAFNCFSFIYQKQKHSKIDYDTHMDHKYLVSTIKAIELFSIYVTQHGKTSMNIINEINKVYQGCISLEELLDKFEVNNKEAIDIGYSRKLFERFDKK